MITGVESTCNLGDNRCAMNSPSDELQIYYAASVRGGTIDRAVYRAQIEQLSTFGKVLTEHLGNDSPQALDMGMTDAAIYHSDAQWLALADIVVAEVSSPSLGVGFQLGTATQLGKKILCLYQGNKPPSAMIAGCPHLLFQSYETTAQSLEIIKDFVKQKRIFLMGPPGCGKGTASHKLRDRYGVVHVSTGDLVRAKMNAINDPLADELRSYVEKGALVPASLMEQLVIERLKKRDCQTLGYVLDGYPPSKADLDNLLRNNIQPTHVFLLECADEIAVERQTGRLVDPLTSEIYHETFKPATDPEIAARLTKRSTDQQERARYRISVYHDKMAEVIAWFSKDPSFFRIDASASSEKVFGNITQLIDHKAHQPIFPKGSYYLRPIDGEERSARFHNHVDAQSHGRLQTIVKEIDSLAPNTHTKVYPIVSLQLGPQLNSTEFASVYQRMPNFRTIEHAHDEAFATGKMGENGIDYHLLQSALKTADCHPQEGVMVELEEYVFEMVFGPDGASKLLYDYGLTDTQLEAEQVKDFQSKAVAGCPQFEIHHGFDIEKSSHPDQPIELSDLMNLCQQAGFDNGGWFLFGKTDHWAYRSNEFSNQSYEQCRAKTENQASLLRTIIGTLGDFSYTQSCSLEKVFAIWRF
jgi:adenylate kinase